MIDLEEIKKHRRYWEPVHKENLPTICEHVDALVEEVERLRGECGKAYLQGVKAYLQGVKAGRDAERIAERAAVVAYLRELGEINSMLSPMKGAADDIELGEHRREEEP
jgi:hypothetical protein